MYTGRPKPLLLRPWGVLDRVDVLIPRFCIRVSNFGYGSFAKWTACTLFDPAQETQEIEMGVRTWERGAWLRNSIEADDTAVGAGCLAVVGLTAVGDAILS